MKKAKFKRRIEKAVEAFFDEEILGENNSLAFSSDMNCRLEDYSASLPAADKKGNLFTKIFKQVFLFFPGTFVLFYMSMGTIFFLTDILTKEIFIPSETKSRLILAYAIGFLSIFMTWFGLGDWRKREHLAIPASIMMTGVCLGIFIQATEGIFTLAERIIHDFGYAVYLFPLALIVPVLTKSWIDGRKESAGMQFDKF